MEGALAVGTSLIDKWKLTATKTLKERKNLEIREERQIHRISSPFLFSSFIVFSNVQKMFNKEESKLGSFNN